MSARTVVRLFAALMLGVGGLITWIAAYDPVPDESTWETTTAEVAELRLVDTQKSGRLALLRLDGVEEEFLLRGHVQREPGLQRLFEERIVPGLVATITAAPAPQGGWSAASPTPRYALRIAVEGAVIHDQRAFDAAQSPAWLGWIGLVVGPLVAVFGVTLLVLSVRLGRPG